jgi:hypothetical protein
LLPMFFVLHLAPGISQAASLPQKRIKVEKI